MLCPKCGRRNNYYHRYCYYCGTKLVSDEEILENDWEYSGKESESNIVIDIQPEENAGKEPEPPKTTENADLLFSDQTQQKLYAYIFEDENSSDEFDLTSTMPLRRYRKERNKPRLNLSKLAVILPVVAVIVIYIGFMVYSKLNKSPGSPVTDQTQENTDSFKVETTTLDNKPAHKITVMTSYGEMIKVLDKTAYVKNGKAEIILEDAYLYSIYSTDDSKELEISLDVFIYKEGVPAQKLEIPLTLKMQPAPLSLLQPSSGEAFVEGRTYNLVFKVQPGSQVYINGDNYSDLIDREGRVEKSIDVPHNPENIYEIRVVTEGYIDTVKQIILKRRTMEIPLSINEPIPVKTFDKWARITGITDPNAKLDVDLKTKFEPKVDPQTGEFTIYVLVSNPGYTPCILTAHLEGKKDSVLEVILERVSTEREYTTKAWMPQYQQLKKYPTLHNGKTFVFTGTIKKLIATGDKNVFTVDISENPSKEQLFYVEYWGEDFDFREGDKIKVFGNRWGNRENIPRILAKFIYHTTR